MRSARFLHLAGHKAPSSVKFDYQSSQHIHSPFQQKWYTALRASLACSTHSPFSASSPVTNSSQLLISILSYPDNNASFCFNWLIIIVKILLSYHICGICSALWMGLMPHIRLNESFIGLFKALGRYLCLWHHRCFFYWCISIDIGNISKTAEIGLCYCHAGILVYTVACKTI